MLVYGASYCSVDVVHIGNSCCIMRGESAVTGARSAMLLDDLQVWVVDFCWDLVENGATPLLLDCLSWIE